MIFALGVIAKTTIVLAFAGLMTLALRRASASVRHAVWAIALLSALILPIASMTLPEVALPVLPENTFDVTTAVLPLSEDQKQPASPTGSGKRSAAVILAGSRPAPSQVPPVNDRDALFFLREHTLSFVW